MAGKAGMRAWSFEKRIEVGRGGELAWKCRREMKRKVSGGKRVEGWEGERRDYYVSKRMEFGSGEEVGKWFNERGRINGNVKKEVRERKMGKDNRSEK